VKEALRDAIENRGYTSLTPVQDAVLAPELEGRDLLVSAQTGSGKTLGFGIAIAPALLGAADRFEAPGLPLALIIAPTRELALQVQRELGWLYAGANAVVTSCVGGMDMRDERRALARGAHIVVATPGRLRDHLTRGSIDLAALRAVVLDEADEMLDLGFREDLEFILNETPEARQTLLFSATVPAAIEALARSYQRDAIRVETRSGTVQHADIEYRALSVAERDAENAVINTLRYYEAPNAIVFANTRAMVNRLTTRLSNRGFQVVALSGELSQSERTHALQAMRDGRARVCVATDVAARGIDLPNLDLVVHAELPSNHETLLHRSGRTGRAGRKGVSALIVTGKSYKKAQRLLKMAKLTADWSAAPSADAVLARDEERMLANPDWAMPVGEAEQAGVDRLMDTFSAEQIAVAYLRLYRMAHSAPEDLTEAEVKPAPREAFGPSIWFAVSGGRKAFADPRRLLPQLCRAGDVTRDDIGAIRVQDTLSYVQIRTDAVAGFLKALGPEMALETGAVVSRLDGDPVLDRPTGKAGKPKGTKGAARPPKHASATPRDPQPAYKAAPAAMKEPAAHPAAKTEAPSGHSKRKPDRAPSPSADKRGGGEPPRRPDTGQPQGAGKPGKKPKGPPPPMGKPSSKKNKARALAAKTAKATKRRK